MATQNNKETNIYPRERENNMRNWHDIQCYEKIYFDNSVDTKNGKETQTFAIFINGKI